MPSTADQTDHPYRTTPFAHTYSIVARDPATGALGVAVQSHFFAVGAIVSWAEAGVGAVATQAFSDPSYGKLGLDLMRAGRSATETLSGLATADAGRALRQVAMVDAHGGAAAHTGGLTIPAAGHQVGEGFSVQANMMLRDTVWPAMAASFTTAAGDFAERLMAALEAGESAGGDIRGRQSAALLVVAGQTSGRPWADTLFDLRVDDALEPLIELRRLLRLARGYQGFRRAQDWLSRGDCDRMEAEYRAAEELLGDNPEIRFWHAIALLQLGRLEAGFAILAAIARQDPNWLELARRLPEPMLRADPGLTERLEALASRHGDGRTDQGAKPSR